MIHMVETEYASPVLRNLMTSERTMQDDERMLAIFSGVPENHTFVDKYGPESIFAQVGLSWWRDVVPRLNEDFILSPEECGAVAQMVMTNMPPSPTKVIQAMGEGTELAHCAEQYPEAEVIRDPSIPYSAIDQSVFFFKLGQLVGFLNNGAYSNGIVVSP
jgi:hypothetical protein